MPEAPRGVFYRPEDYLSVTRRLFIDGVDTLVAAVLSIAVTLGVFSLVRSGTNDQLIALMVWTVVWFLYFVALKGSRWRTAGYLLAGARIVSLQGERPSLIALTGRLLFVVAGPINFLVDLLWIPSDPARQALRDKFAHTYVVKKDAVPAGACDLVYRTYNLFGATLIFLEAKLPSAA